MRSWVYGATYGAASSAIVLAVGSLLIPRNDLVSDEPPTAQINSDDLAATASAEGQVKALSTGDSVTEIAAAPPSVLPDAPVMERDFAGEVQLSVPEIGAMDIAELAGVPAEVPSIPLTIGNWSAPRVTLVGLGDQPIADIQPTLDLSKPPYYGVGKINATEVTTSVQPNTQPMAQPVETGEGTLVSDSTFGRTGSKLPQVGVTDTPAPDTSGDAPTDAISQNAAAWIDNGLPKIAVVLTGVTDGFNVPPIGEMPVSVIISALDADALSDIEAARAVGQEVVLATPLPEGATASDTQVAFETYREMLASAVAIVEAGEGQFRSRGVAEAVVDFAVAQGLGLVSISQGLNPVIQLAPPAGAHASLVERDLSDIAGDDGAIKRALDQAAFKAGQEGSIILFAPANPVVLSALRDWQDSTRGKTVSLAPLSAVLKTK